MKTITKAEANVMLFDLLERTLLNESDICFLKNKVKNNPHSLPMKGIIYYYDDMEKKEITTKDKDILDTLMYFFGP